MYDTGIIGAGPAGYTLAIRLSQANKKVVLFEKNFVGGVCLNLGCIPTKSILHSCSLFEKILSCEKFGIKTENTSADFEKIMERKNSVVEKMRKSLEKLIKSYGIEIIYGEASIEDKNKIICNGNIYECENIVVATGSEPSMLPKTILNENEKKDFVLNSNDILELRELPKSIAIIGSGAIGIEWARIFSLLKVEVHIIEMADRLLPLADIEISQRIERILKRNKVKIYISNSVEKIENKTIYLKNGEIITAEKVLSAIGRKPVKPNSKIDFNTESNIYTIGDVSSKIQLAHNAIHQAINLSEFICNGIEPSNFEIPSVIYGEPEIAWVGKTEQELIEEKKDYKKFSYPISALGKAQADGEIEGFVKLLSVNEIIIGAHIISPEASSLICEFILPVQKKMAVKELSNICHPHPTYSEASFEAIMGLQNKPLTVMKGF